jgi:hypothetical protein
MKFPDWLLVFGDTSFRGDCPKESAEQITFFTQLRKEYPHTLGILALHPKNEEKRSGKQFNQLARDKAMGLSPGASDVIIPLGFACEMKRMDHTKCSWQPGQLDYLEAVHNAGGFACVALGWQAAMEAVKAWEKHRNG